jgi:signal transduction histidine kinase
MPMPASIDVPPTRFPVAVEATAYFVVAEGLTNVAKHARAQRAWVTIAARDQRLSVELRDDDDGVGGAARGGSGLLGMEDRLAALEGRLDIESPVGGGTRIIASIPLPRSVRIAHVRQYGEDATVLGGGRSEA